MDNNQREHHQSHSGGGDAAARPSLGFPLGTALLLMTVFCLSGVFSCCYHWEKLRSIRNRGSRSSSAVGDVEAAHEVASSSSSPSSSTVKPSGPHARPDWNKERKICQSVPVLMPGEEAPTFIAMPCPPVIFDSTSTSSSSGSGSTNGVAPHVTAVTTQLDVKTKYHSHHNVENSSSSSSNSMPPVRDRIARFGFYYYYNC
ncbi:hypothetical protein Syun_013517 [Stephania yunnanensis]|uniref:Hydroxyproline-rich glycoprotein family protein n=1 Tax=Stephania yunnanensis TaxID=152371 RepID=A0AAP0JHT2_9MAGN